MNRFIGWNTFIGHLIVMILLIVTTCVLTGCSGKSEGMEANKDIFIIQIYKLYPELKNHNYSHEEVKRVVDGDTFETKSGAKIRLIGVNTPETVKPNSPIEPYGKEASNFTKQQLTGKSVYLFQDVDNKDKYGRLLRYVFIAEHATMFNEELVKQGYANTMTIPPNVMFQGKFLKLERDARESKKGLWADPVKK